MDLKLRQFFKSLMLILSVALISACTIPSDGLPSAELKQQIKFYEKQTYFCFLNQYLEVENPNLSIDTIAVKLHQKCTEAFIELRMAKTGFANTPDAIEPTPLTIEKELNQSKAFVSRVRKHRDELISIHKDMIDQHIKEQEVF